MITLEKEKIDEFERNWHTIVASKYYKYLDKYGGFEIDVPKEEIETEDFKKFESALLELSVMFDLSDIPDTNEVTVHNCKLDLSVSSVFSKFLDSFYYLRNNFYWSPGNYDEYVDADRLTTDIYREVLPLIFKVKDEELTIDDRCTFEWLNNHINKKFNIKDYVKDEKKEIVKQVLKTFEITFDENIGIDELMAFNEIFERYKRFNAVKNDYERVVYKNDVLETELKTLKEVRAYEKEKLNTKYLTVQNELCNYKITYDELRTAYECRKEELKACENKLKQFKSWMSFLIGTTIGAIGYIIYLVFFSVK